MKVPFSPPDITEEEIAAVGEALRSGWITTGPKTKAFEAEIASFVHTNKAVCLNSATAAMEMTLRLLQVGPGDEVITSAYTYTASASVACHVGAKLVLVDTKPGSYEMDYDKLEAAITHRTKVIIPVDLAGRMCDYDRIFQIVEENRSIFTPKATSPIQKAMGRVAVLADGAHAFGASRHGKMCGEVADFTSYSFHAVKNLTTGEGGAVVWRPIEGIRDEWIYKQYQLLSLHGQNKDALAKTKAGAWEYDIISTSYKCNMTDICAAIGLAQFKRYPGLLERRREIIGRYNEGFSALNVEPFVHYGADFSSTGHLYMLQLTGKTEGFRNALITRMAEEEVACNVHYKPLPLHTAYKRLGFDIADFPHAYDRFTKEITLPLHTCLTDEQVEYVIRTFVKCYKELEAECAAGQMEE